MQKKKAIDRRGRARKAYEMAMKCLGFHGIRNRKEKNAYDPLCCLHIHA